MKRAKIIESVGLPIIEIAFLISIFFFAYYLRSVTDWIPFKQLPIPYISKEQFIPFVISGVVLWCIIFATGGLYSLDQRRSIFEEIQGVLWRSFLWFLFYIGFVYLSLGFIFTREIPRLIILYVWLLGTIMSILIRVGVYVIKRILYKKNIIKRDTILILGQEGSIEIPDTYNVIYTTDREEIRLYLREREIETLLIADTKYLKDSEELSRLAAIYGTAFAYPKILDGGDISRYDRFIGDTLVVESRATSIGAWERIIKRVFDIVIALSSLILLSPILILIAIAIKVEDPSGPVIYKNRRVGFAGKEFFLYKFRYMYWKYSIKDSYGIENSKDSALAYEEKLKKNADTREGPLYKIKDDPRKTRVGKIIERLSLDELPQFFNVLIGNMSFIGPRPHQPREVENYQEHHYQVLTVKPGITGMAQVSGREKNSFEDEVRYDRYYIEHYSPLLDIMILLRTFVVVIARAFR